ncbi:helix-turn-helix domain-containing protein [Candidatus Latescibacterota bacterium]
MTDYFDIISFILLLGIGQGVFLAAILIHKRENRFVNIFLAALMLLLSIDLSYYFLTTIGIHPSQNVLGVVYVGNSLLFAPLYYLYVRSLTKPGRGFHINTLAHFIPFAIYKTYIVFLTFFRHIDLWNPIYFFDINNSPIQFDLYNQVVNVQMIAYIIACTVLLRRYHKEIKDRFSTLEHLQLRWLVFFTSIIFTLWLVAFIVRLILIWHTSLYIESIIAIGIAVLIYALGYRGLLQREVFFWDATVTSPQKYERSGLDNKHVASLLARLRLLMEQEQPYEKNDLVHSELASMLDIPPYQLSQLLNEHLNRNFYDFVNGYRIERAKLLLKDPEYRKRTILAIAYESGFNSKSSFNTAFKKHTRMTPSQYLTSQRVNNK